MSCHQKKSLCKTLQEDERSWETGSVIPRNSAALNSYSSIVLETKKGVEGGEAEEERPARLMSSGRARLLPEFPHSEPAAPADRDKKHKIWSLNPPDPSVTSPFPISSFLGAANSPPLQAGAEIEEIFSLLKSWAQQTLFNLFNLKEFSWPWLQVHSWIQAGMAPPADRET